MTAFWFSLGNFMDQVITTGWWCVSGCVSINLEVVQITNRKYGKWKHVILIKKTQTLPYVAQKFLRSHEVIF